MGKTKTSSKKNKTERLRSLREMLEQERDQILQQMKEKHHVSEIVSHGDLVDQSNDYTEREKLLGLAEYDRTRLLSINEALSKIDEGTYGICTMCGEDIPKARLKAMPTAKYCIKCQSESEGQR